MSLAQTALAPRPNEAGTSSKADFTWTAELILEEASFAETSKDDLAFIQYYAGLTYMGAAKWQQASNLFAACWKLLPPKELADCAMVWAQALGRLNQADQAVAVLREAIKQAGDNAQLELTLARALTKIGRRAEARIEYEFLLSRFGLQDSDRKMAQGELAALSSKPK